MNERFSLNQIIAMKTARDTGSAAIADKWKCNTGRYNVMLAQLKERGIFDEKFGLTERGQKELEDIDGVPA